MIRKGLVLSALAATVMGAGQAQASVKLAAVSGIINQLHTDSTFSSNNFSFALCSGGSCQTLFTGVSGLHNLGSGGLGSFNSWANTGSYGNTGGYFDNYRFTFTGVGSFFGNRTPPPPSAVEPPESFAEQPVPEPGTWAMMIFGFGLVGLAMRRKAAAANFA